jgi:cytochrome c-type biogenesis protein CcmF
VTVFKNGQEYVTMYPAKWFWAKSEQPTTEVAIRRGFAEDVYIVLATHDSATQSVTLDVTIAPLVNWIWVGFGVLALGTLIALLPETAFAFATIKVPSNAATTSLLLLALVLAPAAVFAQTTGQPSDRSALENSLREDIMCTCGCRRSLANCGMHECHGDAAQTTKLKAMIAKGMTRQEIIAAFVKDFGSEDVLMVPPDHGFNRLAWLFPYLAAGFALIGIVVTARRWARPPTHALAGDTGVDPAMNARLDDELRNLD